jgi:hypothetical protein
MRLVITPLLKRLLGFVFGFVLEKLYLLGRDVSPCVRIFPNLSLHIPHSTFDCKLTKSHSFNCKDGLLYSLPAAMNMRFICDDGQDVGR